MYKPLQLRLLSQSLVLNIFNSWFVQVMSDKCMEKRLISKIDSCGVFCHSMPLLLCWYCRIYNDSYHYCHHDCFWYWKIVVSLIIILLHVSHIPTVYVICTEFASWKTSMSVSFEPFDSVGWLSASQGNAVNLSYMDRFWCALTELLSSIAVPDIDGLVQGCSNFTASALGYCSFAPGHWL